MITLTRRQVQRLRSVFRRSVLGLPARGAHPPLVFSVEDGQVRARYRYAHLALEHATPTSAPASEPVPLPLEALAELEGRDDTPITLEASAPDRAVARWSDRGIPQSREFSVSTLPDHGLFLELPITWAEVPGDLLTALAEATATAAESDSRYALSCLHLRACGEVIGTDGRQVLIRGGFAFPWTDDLLIHRTLLFSCRELPRDRPWSIGRTATQVVLRCEPWTIFLEIATSIRYPDVEGILPPSDSMTTRLRLDPGDATFLADGLSRLPGGDAEHAPVTVELNGRIAVRARGSNSDPATELVLSRSSYSGTAVPFSTNRDFLTRALRLGFREVELTDSKSPIVCRSGPQVYAWQPLDPDAVIEASELATRIESTQQQPQASPTLEPTPGTQVPMNPRPRPEPQTPTAPRDPTATGLVALIREAESLHEALGEARTRSQKLVSALRRQRKQARLMAATLNTLRQLKLQEVAG
jgi:hypothetical protein